MSQLVLQIVFEWKTWPNSNRLNSYRALINNRFLQCNRSEQTRLIASNRSHCLLHLLLMHSVCVHFIKFMAHFTFSLFPLGCFEKQLFMWTKRNRNNSKIRRIVTKAEKHTYVKDHLLLVMDWLNRIFRALNTRMVYEYLKAKTK